MSRSRRAPYKLPYVNHMAKTPVTKEPTTYWEFLEHIGPDTLRKFPLMDQDRGTCTIFGTATALAIANRTWSKDDIPTQCQPRQLTGGNYTNKDANDGLPLKKNIVRYPKETQKRFKKLGYSQVMKLAKSTDATRFVNFLQQYVVVCGGVELGYPMLDSNFKSDKKLVPGFYGNGTDSHTICIVGCYNDKDLGPCFVTKTTNECWYSKTKSGNFVNSKTKVKVGGKILPKKYVSLAIYPASRVDLQQNNTGRPSGIDEVYGLVPGEWPEEPVEDMTDQLKKMAIDTKEEIEKARTRRGRKKLSQNRRVNKENLVPKKKKGKMTLGEYKKSVQLEIKEMKKLLKDSAEQREKSITDSLIGRGKPEEPQRTSINRALKACVCVESNGSGSIVTHDGDTFVLTNQHVALTVGTIKFIMWIDGKIGYAETYWVDKKRDIGKMRIIVEPKDKVISSLPIHKKKVTKGQLLVQIHNPYHWEKDRTEIMEHFPFTVETRNIFPGTKNDEFSHSSTEGSSVYS